MEYCFSQIEQKWQNYWKEKKTFKTEIDTKKPKYYILDMFPYPSGAGLHVGHPLGYIASDILARAKAMMGYNVLHPMGFDAFGLPAEQYAIQTGQHPAITTEKHVVRYREQLDRLGFGYDWDREVRTCDPKYYKWTQWAFVQMFHHYFDEEQGKARPIAQLVELFKKENRDGWNSKSEEEQQQTLLNYRLAYLSHSLVNWCPALGTVLANDEVKEGLSVRGGHPVEQKRMKQWCLRISAYAQRLLDGLNDLEWSDSIKEVQRNWIGRSQGAELLFDIKGHEEKLKVFTTRPDTIFGVTYMGLAPEHPLVELLTTPAQKKDVEDYIAATKKRNERERMADTSVSGAFTGAYALHPITHQEIPIWISDYILMGYGTGAIMAVPAHDSRDYAFAKHFDLPIIQVIAGGEIDEAAFESKEGTLINSKNFDGLSVQEGMESLISHFEKAGVGSRKINYRLRDATFGRQRYWGEPFPVYYKKGLPYTLEEKDLPLELPLVESYLPTEEGAPPLARAKNWVTKEGYPLEVNTMPGFAGSSAYFLRYMDPHNEQELVSREAVDYWQEVDFYLGGNEHATGHLIYSRFWNHFLYDLGKIPKKEPFKKLFNQGMIQGRSQFVYRVVGTNQFVSAGLKDHYKVTPIHVDVNIVKNDILDLEQFKAWRAEFHNAEFILEDGHYYCGSMVEKMSKSLYNVVNPDALVAQYGSDAFRMYEMFLGPLDQSKPWITNGLEGVSRFLNKFWKLFFNESGWCVSDEEASKEELKILHKTLKKVTQDIEALSLNTCISTFMVCVNELSKLKCQKRAILEPLTLLISPFAPHLGEELWEHFGHKESISKASLPKWDESYLVESSYSYPVSFNGKTRFLMELSLDLSPAEIEEQVRAHDQIERWCQGKAIKKVIIIPNKIINIVC